MNILRRCIPDDNILSVVIKTGLIFHFCVDIYTGINKNVRINHYIQNNINNSILNSRPSFIFSCTMLLLEDAKPKSTLMSTKAVINFDKLHVHSHINIEIRGH